MAAGVCKVYAVSEASNAGAATTAVAHNGAASDSSPATPSLAAGIEPATLSQPVDSCALAEITANPARPAWDWTASTTQCGIAEIDSGWMDQTMGPGAMGAGVRQEMFTSSMRYGLTPKLDLRWLLTSHIAQSGGDTASLGGIGDQWINARYRFVEQGRWVPALAFDYAVKIPTANPAKGFGSGFADQQYILIASRDLGKNHFDFNAVGTLAGEAHGHDGAAQFGLALTRPVTKRLSWILESYGGPQPGTPDRFGAAFTGGTYALRPGLVFDGAYTRTYTAGSPRQQILFGFTCAIRPGFATIPKGSVIARLLGR
jgi:hypothetical protein